MMQVVVLDANVLISGVVGLERQESTPGAVLRAWQSGLFTLVSSEPLISEVRRALADRYFQQRLQPRQVDRFLASLRLDATVVEISVTVHGVATHPEDDLVLGKRRRARIFSSAETYNCNVCRLSKDARFARRVSS